MDQQENFGDEQDDVLEEQEPDDVWPRFAAEEEQDSFMAPPRMDDDRLSFEDSERFEDDESFVSESESLNNKWRGWSSRQNPNQADDGGRPHDKGQESGRSSTARTGTGTTLAELAARKAAKVLSFDVLENHYQSIKPGARIPDSLLLPILRYCFPDNDEDIRLYSCLTNGHAMFYSRGEQLFQSDAVKQVVQIGYHISAEVAAAEATDGHMLREEHHYDVSLKVDRCRIVECSCSCTSTSAWCEHVVAVCLHRMHRPDSVEFRPTVWDSITELGDDQLKKFAQYLLNDLPRKYLPVAQRLIDQLRDPGSDINQVSGAPDPTAGDHDDVAIWCLDERNLHDNIRKILISFVKPSPTVCDVQHLSSAYPPTSDEWNLLMKPLRSKEPRALWNLLSIVEEMLKRSDENATILLHAITEHCIAVPQMLTWWYQSRLLRSGYWRLNVSCHKSHLHALMSSTQYNAGFLCDQIVHLWRLAALNPKLGPFEKDQLASLLQMYHQTVVRRLWKIIPNLTPDHYNSMSIVDDRGSKLSQETASFAPDQFAGFLPALRASYLEWDCDTLRDFASANDFTRLEQSIAEARNSSRSDSPDSCPHIPLLRNGVDDLKDAFEDEVCVTTTFNIQDIFSSSRSKRPNKKRKRKKHRSRRHGAAQASTSRRADNRAVGGEAPGAASEDSAPEDEGCAESSSKETAARKEPFDDDVQLVFAMAHSPLDPLDEKYAFCTGLSAHGFQEEGFCMAVEIAKALISETPSVLYDISPSLLSQAFSIEPLSKRRGNYHKALCEGVAQIRRSVLPDMVRNSQAAEDLLSTAGFLVKTLCGASASDDSNLLAIQLALKVISNPRGPAGTRHHEVSLHHLEEELFRTIHKIPVGPNELRFLRQFANVLIASCKSSAPQRITVPSTLAAHYLFQALSCSAVFQGVPPTGSRLAPPAMTPTAMSMRSSIDEDLALSVALEALAKTVFVSELDHPMLCECIRRQRGDFSMTLLLRYKDCPDKLGYVMDRILDPRIHKVYEDHKSNAAYFFERTNAPCERSIPLLLETLTHSEVQDTACQEQLAKEVAEKLVCYSDSREADAGDSVPGRLDRRRNTDESTSGESRDDNSPRPSESNSSDTCKESYTLTDYAKTTSSQSPASLASQSGSRAQRRPRAFPTFPCASEAQAHFMIEFAKRILSEAGGNQSATMFNAAQNMPGQAAPGIHRNLHMCSFLAGLYALGLNNMVSPSWKTRTYSTHVSWIKSQAQEIGKPALELLRRTWERHLTPSEMAELSDKVGQTGDPTVVEEAALLAASVLPKAYALEYTQSQKALNQCREHSSKLLEKACVAVEKAAEKDGVHPDVLFQVARHWFQLHSEVPEAAVATSSSHVGYAANPLHYQALPPAAFNAAVPPPAHPTHYGHGQATQHPVPHGVPLAYMPAAHGQHAMPVPNASYGYSVQHAPIPSAQRAPPQPNVVQPRLHVSHSAPNLQPGYGPPPLGHASNPYGMPGNHRQMIAHHPPDFATAPPPGRFPVNVTLQHSSISYNPHQRYGMAAQMPSTSAHHVQQQPAGHQYTSVMSVDSRKARLINAHRVGLRAMDMLAYRPADDNRCYVKFSENPKHGDDIRWLYDVSVELGVPYVIAFCEKAANSVASPFILFHLVKESAQFFGWAVGRHSYPVYHNASGPTSDFSQTQNRTTGAAQRVPSGQPGTSNSVGRALPLPSGDVGKCYSGQAKKTLLDQGYAPASADLMRQLVEMLYMAAFHKLNHPKFTESDADDVRQLVRVARESFSMLPPGQAKSMFIAYFHYMRKQKACKKEVSHMISSLFNNPYDS